MPEFSTGNIMDMNFSILRVRNDLSCNMILGSHALKDLQAKFNYKESYAKICEICIEMKSKVGIFDLENSQKLYFLFASVYFQDKPDKVKKASKRAEDILDAAHEKADLKQIMHNCAYLKTA